MTCSWEVVEYVLYLLKRCLRFAWRNPENVFIKRRRLSSFTFIYELWLVITASWEHPAAVVFMSYKFMSSCVICLVIAKQIFLFQSDCLAITKRAYFFVIELIMINLKAEDTLHKLDIFWHRTTTLGGLFPLECQSLCQTFQQILQALLFVKHLHHFCCWPVWEARTKLSSKKNWKVFHHCHPFLGA